MNTGKYNLSFVGGALFHRESVKLAGRYLEKGDWNAVRDEVMARNLLQARTTSSARRICREICSRLKRLNKDEMELLVEGDYQEQASLLWIAVCRHYRFICEFSIEVIRERFLTLRYDLGYEDFDVFFNAKMEWHEELGKIATGLDPMLLRGNPHRSQTIATYAFPRRSVGTRKNDQKRRMHQWMHAV